MPSRQTGASPVVVLMGRPNVGKSTLFNRLCTSRQAITSDIPGTTRDWLQGTAHWGDRVFNVVDTGGYDFGEESSKPSGTHGRAEERAPTDVLASVRGQVKRWAAEADAVVWVVDAVEGLTPQDAAIARWLRPLGRRILLAVNKVDDAKREVLAAEFHRLGIQDVVPISANHGRSINRLLDRLMEMIPAARQAEESGADVARVAILGRPNVGKSSLLNRLIGEERVIVSDQPGTTRDTVDTRLELDDKRFLFTDTAGLRAKKSKAGSLEGLTRIMSEKALDRADVALLMVDASEPLMEGDVAVARLIEQKQRACVVAINKWDLIATQEKVTAAQWFRAHQPEDMPFLDYAPLFFISAHTGLNVPKLLEALWEAHRQFHRRFDDEELSAFFWGEVQNRPYSYHGRKLVFRDAAQVAVGPPTIVVRSNLTDDHVHFSYQRHLENVFRQRYGFTGSPLALRFRRK